MKTAPNKLVEVALALAETIASLGEIPNGHLYARVLGQISLEEYRNAIELLEQTGAVTVSNYMIRWNR